MRFIQRKTCMAFLVLGLKLATINYYSICVIVLYKYKVTFVLAHHWTTMFVKDIYMIIFCLMEAIEMFFSIFFFLEM